MDLRKKRYEALRSAQIKLLTDFYNEEIKPTRKLLSIVGDSTKIDLEKLAEIGPITKVKAEDLYSLGFAADDEAR